MDAFAHLAALVASQRRYRPFGLLQRALSALLAPGACVVASGMSGAPALRYLRQRGDLALQRFLPACDLRVQDFGQSRSDVTEQTGTWLSDEDIDIELRWAPAVIGGPADPVLRWCRHRRVDTLFAGVPAPAVPPAALVIEETPARCERILLGSASLLSTAQPVVALTLGDGPETERLLALLAGKGYVVLDQNLRAWAPSTFDVARRRMFGEAILAVPVDAGLERLGPALFGTSVEQIGPGPEGWNHALATMILREARAGGVRFVDYGGADEITLPLDGDVPTWGFYPPERSGDATWRWIGPRPEAGIVLPGLDVPLAAVKLFLVALGSPANRGGLAARLDGRAAATRWHDLHGYWEVEIAVPATVADCVRPSHCLELRWADSRCPGGDDSRHLVASMSAIQMIGARG